MVSAAEAQVLSDASGVEVGRSRQMVLACALMVASGFAGLAYQIVWTQQSTSWLGHESAAVLAVVAAFFGGLAVGALTLGSRIDRSARPARWYAACEVVIGVWSLALAALLQPASSALLALIGPQPSLAWHWFVAFFGTLLLLLPATMAMGATLPAMERVFATTSSRSISISALYAANTTGAVLGVLAAAFWLVPELGLTRSALVCALLNFACAATAMLLQKNATADPDVAAYPSKNTVVSTHGSPHLQTNGFHATTASAAGIQHPATTSAATSMQSSALASSTTGTQSSAMASAAAGMQDSTMASRPSIVTGAARSRRVLLLLAATGLLGIGYEVLVVRALSQIAENTVYTFALLLAVYLIGTAMGAAIYGRRLATTSALIQTLAAACLLGTLLLAGANDVKNWVISALGPSVGSALVAESVIAALAFLLPTIVMGALFSHLSTSARDNGISFGQAIGINTLGAAVAPLLFGVLLLPAAGLKSALLLITAGYALLGVKNDWLFRLILAGLAACMLWMPSLHNTSIPEGGKLVRHFEGVMASVSVIEDANGVATLHINNRQQEGSSATLLADARQALLPILLHPNPKHALFLGLGTGLTASSATLQPGLQVDVVELVPQVIEASAQFASSYSSSADLSRFHTMSGDARRFVRTSDQLYDVMVADNFHPARSGSASLYTVEHFEAVRARLAQGGVFCQWLPLHQLDLDTLRSIVRSYLNVFPRGVALLATNSLDTPTVGLISHRDGEPFNVDQVHAQLDTGRSYHIEQFGISDDLALLGSFIAGPRSLAKFASSAPLNTDDRPIVAYRAPNIAYSPTSTPRDRLLELLHDVEISPQDLLSENDANTGWGARLNAYWTARNRFMEAGRDVRASSDVREMLAQVREPLLSILHISPDFRPAYDPLVRMAMGLAQVDPEGARSLLLELQAAQPLRPEAAAALEALSSSH